MQMNNWPCLCHFRVINQEMKAVQVITDTWGENYVRDALINVFVLTCFVLHVYL